ncbi:hypothetical protein J6590_059189 [Homalodisca vitripennis]|nr:hypothetical protein J6590_059189 [Homalodisca vitripennis]
MCIAAQERWLACVSQAVYLSSSTGYITLHRSSMCITARARWLACGISHYIALANVSRHGHAGSRVYLKLCNSSLPQRISLYIALACVSQHGHAGYITLHRSSKCITARSRWIAREVQCVFLSSSTRHITIHCSYNVYHSTGAPLRECLQPLLMQCVQGQVSKSTGVKVCKGQEDVMCPSQSQPITCFVDDTPVLCLRELTQRTALISIMNTTCERSHGAVPAGKDEGSLEECSLANTQHAKGQARQCPRANECLYYPQAQNISIATTVRLDKMCSSTENSFRKVRGGNTRWRTRSCVIPELSISLETTQRRDH